MSEECLKEKEHHDDSHAILLVTRGDEEKLLTERIPTLLGLKALTNSLTY